jgi:hypothetical protein
MHFNGASCNPSSVSAPDSRPFYVSGFLDLDQIHKINFYLYFAIWDFYLGSESATLIF